jgi:hypothetical protein
MIPEELKKYINELIDEALTEMEGATSVTGAGEAYTGKKAFLEPQKTGQAAEYLVKVFGYSKAKKPKNIKTFDVVKFKESINEISYRRFNESVSKITPERKITRALQEVSKRIKEIEQVIEYSNRLKTENTIKKESFWENKTEQLKGLSKRLNELSNKVRNLSK